MADNYLLFNFLADLNKTIKIIFLLFQLLLEWVELAYGEQ